MPASLDSSRPIMEPSIRTGNRSSVRHSTYSTLSAATANTARTDDSATAEISTIETGLRRMDDKRLVQQRVLLTEEQSVKFSKLALGAKLERALGRRMTSQDAVMRPRRAHLKPACSEKEIKA